MDILKWTASYTCTRTAYTTSPTQHTPFTHPYSLPPSSMGCFSINWHGLLSLPPFLCLVWSENKGSVGESNMLGGNRDTCFHLAILQRERRLGKEAILDWWEAVLVFHFTLSSTFLHLPPSIFTIMISLPLYTSPPPLPHLSSSSSPPFLIFLTSSFPLLLFSSPLLLSSSSSPRPDKCPSP